MTITENNKEQIAAKLYNDGLTMLNYTKEKAYEILNRTVAPNFCIAVLDADEEQVKTYIKRFHLADIIESFLIGNIEDVKTFFSFLVKSEDLNLDIDLPFEDYVSGKELQYPTYQPVQAKALNSIMESCFTICEDKGKDIYEYAVEALQTELRSRLT